MSDKKSSGQAGSSMALNDIYFVLFRHKWKIIVLTALGFLAAAGIYVFKPPTYQSEADLFIKYVNSDAPETRGVGDPRARQLDSGVEGVMGTEVEIIKSFDLALQVATNIGPAKILGDPNGANDRGAANAAANKIRDNLVVERINRSSVLRIVLSHPDLTLVQPILQQLIEDYQQRHKDIHNASLTYDELVQEADARHKELLQTQDELAKAKKDANVYNIERKRESDEQTMSALHQQIVFVSAEIAEHQSKLDQLKPKTIAVATNAVSTTNKVSTNVLADIPKEKITQYQATQDLLSDLRKSYTSMRSVYTEHNSLIVEKKRQIAEQEEIKKKMEEDEPRLVDYVDPATKSPAAIVNGVAVGETSIKQEEGILESLKSKLKIYQDNYQETRAGADNLDARQFHIGELEHKLKLQQDQYDYFAQALQQRKTDAELGTASAANISVVEKPMPPSQERAKTPKMMGVAAIAGIAIGLAWAFLQDLYFDHSVKRAKDIEGDLGMRLFLSIPDMRRNGHARKPKALLPEGDGKEGEAVVAVTNGSTNGKNRMEIAPWDHNHALHNHYEALRDRLITYFEVNNLNHKPKLVAVTGSSHGSGTSTIAAGLAASLSETGDGNVLLIDMNLEQGAAQQFYMGKPHCELETALEGDTMKDAKIQDNLYVVAGRTNNGDKLSSMLPKRFAGLIPKLKASDYDYIIFDMPPISRTGVTQRLSGFMDMMMLVVEAEKTNRDVVRQANTLLTESKAKVSVVLNKTHNYVPARLHQEF